MATLFLCLLCLVLLADGSFGADYRYGNCQPVNCSSRGPKISFPFYIPDKQHPYCGFPGFGLVTCSPRGFPLLSFSGGQYIIDEINYQNRSLRVHDSLLSDSNSSCLLEFKSISSNQLPAKLQFARNVSFIHLFSNCSNPMPSAVQTIACSSNNTRVWPWDADSVGNCTSITVPVEKQTDGEMEDVEQVLKKGFVLNWTAPDCNDCENSRGYCGFNETLYRFQCFCPDRPHSRSCKRQDTRVSLLVVSVISGCGIFLIVCIFVLYIIWKRKGMKSIHLLKRCISKQDVEAGGNYFGIPIFSYNELEGATDNFDSSKELGDGGFGTVYYGKLQDGREVAVKRLYEHNSRRIQQYMNEITILTGLRHQNLVSLYGCTSRKSKELLLVYEYIPNGTVGCHLHGERAKEAPLSWPIRLKIAVETAGALAYLHKSDIIHRDVKTDNILLDINYCVKVADLGLSRLCPTDVTHISTAPQGTPGYVDPEYHQCYRLTDKSDVYSFGVVLVELVSSLPAVDITRRSHEINLANLALNKIQMHAIDELIDKSLGYETDAEVRWMTIAVAELAFRCLQLDKDARPSMDEVLDTLKEIQSGEKKEAAENSRKMPPPSPETDDVMLLKNKNFQSSPNTVTDRWFSSSTVASTLG